MHHTREVEFCATEQSLCRPVLHMCTLGAVVMPKDKRWVVHAFSVFPEGSFWVDVDAGVGELSRISLWPKGKLFAKKSSHVLNAYRASKRRFGDT